MEPTAAWLLSFALHYVLQLAVLVRALTRPEREPASRLAWLLVILAVPGLGVILYLLLGEVNPGRRVLARLRKLRAVLPTMPPGAETARVPDRGRAAFDRAASVNGFAPLGGNRATLPSSAAATLATAVICGTPTPAMMRVVQIDPGPTPTLTPSAPASTSALAASAVTTLPPTTCSLG